MDPLMFPAVCFQKSPLRPRYKMYIATIFMTFSILTSPLHAVFFRASDFRVRGAGCSITAPSFLSTILLVSGSVWLQRAIEGKLAHQGSRRLTVAMHGLRSHCPISRRVSVAVLPRYCKVLPGRSILVRANHLSSIRVCVLMIGTTR